MRTNRAERNAIKAAAEELDRMADEITKLRAKVREIENRDPNNRQALVTFATVAERDKFLSDMDNVIVAGHVPYVRPMGYRADSRRPLIGAMKVISAELPEEES